MDIITFDPTVETLNKIVAETSTITAADLSDDTQLAVVKATRISLRDARVTIEKQGKAMRADALKYQKDVIARENELIAIIEPEEIRLKALEEEAVLIKVREARKELLPMRESMLVGLDCNYTINDLLEMDNDQFITFLNDATAAKNTRDRIEIENEKIKLADAARLEQVRKEAEVAERNRIEAQQKADEEARIEKAAQAKRDAELYAQKLIDDARYKIAQEAAQAEAAAREQAVREQQAKDEAAKRETQVKYLEWAKEQGWTPEEASSYATRITDAGIELWKRIGTYTE